MNTNTHEDSTANSVIATSELPHDSTKPTFDPSISKQILLLMKQTSKSGRELFQLNEFKIF